MFFMQRWGKVHGHEGIQTLADVYPVAAGGCACCTISASIQAVLCGEFISGQLRLNEIAIAFCIHVGSHECRDFNLFRARGDTETALLTVKGSPQH